MGDLGLKNNDCIVYLIRATDKDVGEFIKSIRSLEKYFLPHNSCDILCFHEKDLLPYMNDIQNSVEVNLKFSEITFSIPDFYQTYDIPEYFPHPTHGNGPIAWGHPGFSMGYRHMCRFFSGEFYKRSELDDYDYYMRMDTDSFILGHVNYNVFQKMRSENKNYGFIAPAVQIDNPKVVEGLWDACLEWYNSNLDICLASPMAVPDGKMYYTNFEIGKVEWFRGEKYTSLYNYLDRAGGMFTKRWGDAPIRFVALGMLMEENQKYPIYDVPYQHGAIYNV